MGTPELPSVSSPSVDLNGAVEILIGIAWSMSAAALSPVDLN